jgi:hypothetical protein
MDITNGWPAAGGAAGAGSARRTARGEATPTRNRLCIVILQSSLCIVHRALCIVH